MDQQVWQRLPDITPNYGSTSRNKISAIPRTSRERIVILRTNPGHNRQLTTTLDYLEVERLRTVRQLDLVRHTFIERQARKQRRLEEAGVRGAALLPAHLMQETEMTSQQPQQHLQRSYSTPAFGNVTFEEVQMIDVKAQGNAGISPPGDDVTATSLPDVTTGIPKGHRTPAAYTLVLPLRRCESLPTRPTQFGDGFYSANAAVVVVPTGNTDVTTTSQLRHSISCTSDGARIRKMGLPSLIENVDMDFDNNESSDSEPPFAKLIDSLRHQKS